MTLLFHQLEVRRAVDEAGLSFPHLFIVSFYKCLLNACSVQGTEVGSGDVIMAERENLCLQILFSNWGHREVSQQ